MAANVVSTLITLTWRGAFGLGKHVWLIGIVGGVIIAKLCTFLLAIIQVKIILIPVAILVATYNVVAGVGIWNAGTRFKGSKTWVYLSRPLAIWFAVVFPVVFLYYMIKPVL